MIKHFLAENYKALNMQSRKSEFTCIETLYNNEFCSVKRKDLQTSQSHSKMKATTKCYILVIERNLKSHLKSTRHKELREFMSPHG